MTTRTGHLKVVSDGTSENTHLEIDGVRLNNVKYVAFVASADRALVTATFLLEATSVEIDAQNVLIETIPN